MLRRKSDCIKFSVNLPCWINACTFCHACDSGQTKPALQVGNLRLTQTKKHGDSSSTTQANRLTFWSEGVVLRGEQARKGARNPWKGRRIGARKKDRLKERDDEEAGSARARVNKQDSCRILRMRMRMSSLIPLLTIHPLQRPLSTCWWHCGGRGNLQGQHHAS